MYILAVDPGTKFLGYAVFDIETEQIIEYGEWDLRDVEPHNRYSEIHQKLVGIETAFDLESIAVEQAVRFRNRKIPELELAVSTIHRFGMVWLVGVQKMYRSRKYHPSTWKSSITGHAKADKEATAAAVKLRYAELPEGLSDHVTDAIAIGIHHLAARKLEIAVHDAERRDTE